MKNGTDYDVYDKYSYGSYAEVRDSFKPVYRGFTILFVAYALVGLLIAVISGIIAPGDGITLPIIGVMMTAAGIAALYNPIPGIVTWCVGAVISIAASMAQNITPAVETAYPEENPLGWLLVIGLCILPMAAVVKMEQQKAESKALRQVYLNRREEREMETS